METKENEAESLDGIGFSVGSLIGARSIEVLEEETLVGDGADIGACVVV
jgi:hypothetical protein